MHLCTLTTQTHNAQNCMHPFLPTDLSSDTMVQWNAGLGGGVDAASPERSVPGLWFSAADNRRHVLGGVQVHIFKPHAFIVPRSTICVEVVVRRLACPRQIGVPGALQGRATTIQTCSTLKLSTGKWLWNGGRRAQRQDRNVSLYGLLFGTSPRELSDIMSTAPSGVR